MHRWKIVTGSQTTSELDKQAVYIDILCNMFNSDELSTIAYNLGVDYEDLPASGKFGKTRELYDHMRNRGKVDRLIDAIREERPFLFENN